MRLRDHLLLAISGNPIGADDAWDLLHAWDAAERALSIVAERRARFAVDYPGSHPRSAEEIELDQAVALWKERWSV